MLTWQQRLGIKQLYFPGKPSNLHEQHVSHKNVTHHLPPLLLVLSVGIPVAKNCVTDSPVSTPGSLREPLDTQALCRSKLQGDTHC